jgi:hypothetical protein
MQIFTIPKILIVHLKRFRSNNHHALHQIQRGYNPKLKNLVKFPIEDLDLTDLVVSNQEKKAPIKY